MSRSIPTYRQLVGGLLATLLVLASGCATGAGGGGGGGGNPDRLSLEEILTYPNGNFYEVVAAARPSWVRARPAASLQGSGPLVPEVFLDGARWGSLRDLEISGIDTAQVEYAEFISSTDATTLYGTGYQGGVIHVHSRGGPG